MKNRFISLLAAAVLSAGMIFTPAAPSVSAQSAVYGKTLTAAKASSSSVSAPTADKKAGYHLCNENSLKVNLSCKTKNAEIYYKIDNGSYKKYTKTINITKNSTLSAYAKLKGRKSKVVTYKYELGANFSLSVYGGDYAQNQTVKIKTNVSGVKFRYTLNGKYPTKQSKEIPAGGLKIENTETLNVIAFKDGWQNVGYVETYNINKLGNYKANYYYSLLSENQKKGYGRIFSGVEKGSKRIDLSGLKLDYDSTCEMINAFYQDASQYMLYWYEEWYDWEFNGNECIAIIPKYSINGNNTKSMQNTFEKKSAKVIEQAKKKPTAYGKIKYIHDWLVNNTDYVDSGAYSEYLAAGPIVNGKAVCSGYARAFDYLAKGLGFDCIFITGNVVDSDEPHAWNKIKIDGVWYNIDVTWDDMSVYGNDKIYYDNFLKSDKTFSKKYTPDKNYKYPSSPKDHPLS